jgi:hypothetical protein
MINPSEIRRWFDIFHNDGGAVEIRIWGERKNEIYSGYFKDVESIITALQPFQNGYGIYGTVNKLHDACHQRRQGLDKIIRTDTTVSDSDVEGRKWILIDLDPKRPSDTNSTDDEKAAAYSVMLRIATYLRDRGFKSPVYADSANGYHIYYRVELANTDENKHLVEGFLKTLEAYFGNEIVDIDLKVFNAARIAKVIGTQSNKGSNTQERPQRMSCFLQVPPSIEITDIEFIRKVVAEYPQPEVPSRDNGYRRESFDLKGFIEKYGIGIAKEGTFNGGRKFVLKECPFDCNHKAPDAALFQTASGAIGFKCLHNSCSSYGWRDFRLHFDPQAYDRRVWDNYQHKREKQRGEPKPAPVVLDESETIGKKWLAMSEIEWQDPSKLTYIPTGFSGIDGEIGGLCLDDVTILSGIAGAGKTTILNNIILAAIQDGYKAAIWSGELAPARFKSWINQIAAGPNFVKQATSRNGKEYYYCPEEISKQIDAWTTGKIFLYNNNYGNHSSQIIEDIRRCVKENGTQLIVLDNKMAMALDSYEGDKNEREAGLINELKDFAVQSHLHILLVCHPRKEMMNSLLRMESIAGNSDLYNASANVLLCHRVGKDFERRAKDFFGKDFIDDVKTKQYDEVVEIAKNRTHGAKDITVGLYYEGKSRRYLCNRDDYVSYGWQPDDLPAEFCPPVSEFKESEKTFDTYAKPSEFKYPLPDGSEKMPDEDMPDFENGDKQDEDLPF